MDHRDAGQSASSPAVIGVAVVEDGGRYLVGVRGPEGPLPGLAEFPGGKCLPGESPRECVRRECLEETGLEVEPLELLLNEPFTYPHGAVDLHFWLCRPVSGGAVGAEHKGFRWVAAGELQTLRFPDANRALIERLAARG